MRKPFGGEKGIRTLGALASTAVYQTAAISHSAISGQPSFWTTLRRWSF